MDFFVKWQLYEGWTERYDGKEKPLEGNSHWGQRNLTDDRWTIPVEVFATIVPSGYLNPQNVTTGFE